MDYRLLRIDQAARKLNVSKRTVYRLVNDGHFVAMKIGASLRITEPSIDSYVRRQLEKFYIDNGLAD
jgi:excisionase family DNA binding protein